MAKNIRFTNDQLNNRVLEVILKDNPNINRRLTKEAIAIRIYGHYDPSIDRKIRDAVTELTLQEYPICATSDVPGYFIANSYDEASQCIQELRSRSEVYDQKIKGIKRGLLKQPEPEPVVFGEPVQLRLA
jgi:hypothetical protein